MPPENLPEGAKKIYSAAEANARKTTCKNRKDKDACANKIAWSAVKNKYKKVGDKWVPKAELASFSMAITKTSYDKLTNTRRWKAVASDIEDDSYNDNMTLELYENFLQRIESKEQPTESYRSEFWSGGMPYLSISHYPDLNGKGVPGPIDTVYVDGKELKSTGRFDDTPLGKACFQAISRDLDTKSAVPKDEKIRISIAFLDWKHRHKSNGFVFDRSESEDAMCPECLKELLESLLVEDSQPKGKEFLLGHLVHLALTRVPVNQRTKMEVERSMATQKEDAESIIGEELAEELEEAKEEQVIGKSEALVVKSEEEPLVEKKKDKKDDEEEEDEEEMKKKEKKEKKAEVVEEDDLVIDLLNEIKAELTTEPAPSHPLDIAIEELKSVYDEATELPDPQEALRMMQEPFEALAAVIQGGFTQEEPEETSESTTDTAIVEVLNALREEIGLLRAERAQAQAPPESLEIPVRRSVNPALFKQPVTEPEESETPKLREIVRQSVGL